MLNIKRIQTELAKQDLDGWLFCDFRGSDSIAYQVLGLASGGHCTRKWYYFIPKSGEPVKLVHTIESATLDSLPGSKQVYLPWKELEEKLKAILEPAKKIAMQYSANNAIPYISKVDAGTFELIRSFGLEVVSSANLVQIFEAVLSKEQYQTHLAAGEQVSENLDDTFQEIARQIAANGKTDEFSIQEFMLAGYQKRGLISDFAPIVAVGPNSADPHYAPSKASSEEIRSGDFVLIDTWAKLEQEDAIYFDITWVAYVGAKPPDDVTQVFEIVKSARDAAIEFVQAAMQKGNQIAGWQVDDICREVISKAGYSEEFIHRTGHSIDTSTHGNGANMDNLETHDTRVLIPGTCFSIEPGIYLKDKFGIRSEVNLYLTEKDAIVTARPAQEEIIVIEV